MCAFVGNTQHLRATGESKDDVRFGIDLTQTAKKPPVIHGTNGVSQKAAGRGAGIALLFSSHG
jgi:predicted secreted hydrolase